MNRTLLLLSTVLACSSPIAPSDSPDGGAPLHMPGGLHASVLDVVSLSWNAVPGATSYVVHQKWTDPESGKQRVYDATVDGPPAKFPIRTDVARVVYTVSAVFPGGTSDESTGVTVPSALPGVQLQVDRAGIHVS